MKQEQVYSVPKDLVPNNYFHSRQAGLQVRHKSAGVLVAVLVAVRPVLSCISVQRLAIDEVYEILMDKGEMQTHALGCGSVQKR